MSTFYPEFIANLPEAALPVAGAEARLLAGKDGQAVFFTLPEGFVIPPHSHCAQWGVVLSGELELTIAGEKRTYRKGDTYFIADQQIHEASCTTEVHAVDFFADPNRYAAKE